MLAVARPYRDDPSVQASLEPANPYQQLGARGVQAAEVVSAGLVNGARAVLGMIARGLNAGTARAANLGEVTNAARGVAVKVEAPGQARSDSLTWPSVAGRRRGPHSSSYDASPTRRRGSDV